MNPNKWWLAWLSPLVLGVSGAVLALSWDAVPERWIIHWGARGEPNGWADKSFGGAFGPLVLGLLIWLVTEAIGAASEALSKQKLPHVMAATRTMVRLISTSISLTFGGLAVALPLGAGRVPMPLFVIVPLVLVFASVGAGMVLVSRAMKRDVQAGHGPKLEGYNAIYYSNANDPRLWVPKLSGVGMTINFAHPYGLPMMVVLVVLPLVMVAAGLLAAAH